MFKRLTNGMSYGTIEESMNDNEQNKLKNLFL